MASGEGNRMENMRNPFDMSGRVAIITGGATGLGLGMTKALIGFGCRVVMMGRREEVLKKSAEELGPLADYFRLDVTDTEGIVILRSCGLRGGKSVASVVSAAAYDKSLSQVDLLPYHGINDLQRRALHQHNRRDSDLLYCMIIRFLHLFSIRQIPQSLSPCLSNFKYPAARCGVLSHHLFLLFLRFIFPADIIGKCHKTV